MIVIDQEQLLEDAANIDWSAIFATDSVDEQIELFNTLLVELYDVHAPVSPVKMKHLPAPWLTDEIRKVMSKKKFREAKFKVDPSNLNEIKYNRIRNRCNTMIRDAQRRHIHNSVENEDPVKVWKFIKSLGVGKSCSINPVNNLDINQLNSYFSSFLPLDGRRKAETLQRLSNLPTPDSSFFLHQFTDCDVKRTIKTINSSAVGSDSISRKMILPILDILAPIITHILNTSILTGVFPAAWKDANVIPIPKKSNPASFSEYRPISILPFLSKVLEKLVYRQLIVFLNQNQLLNPYQSGFRTGHSTSTALVKIADDIRHGMEERKLTLLTLLDFTNTFNSIDFDILLAILRSLNISPMVIDWFQSYLLGRRQRIRIEENFSAWCVIDAGVPQAGVLSPLLFSIFINSITHSLFSSYHLYADDLQIYTQAPLSDLSDAIAVTNSDLALISITTIVRRHRAGRCIHATGRGRAEVNFWRGSLTTVIKNRCCHILGVKPLDHNVQVLADVHRSGVEARERGEPPAPAELRRARSITQAEALRRWDEELAQVTIHVFLSLLPI
ncbi:hypothetical protein evm_010186 [Chilo suppressalis]|nr:hypothetical protein evm_010186 [Chilo suppressalis]